MMFPPMLNNRSDSTEDAGHERYLRATLLSRGNNDLFSFHHAKGSSDIASNGCFLKLDISV